MELDMVVFMEEDKVAEKVADIEINMEIQLVEGVGHGGWLIGPKLCRSEAYPACASSKLCEFISNPHVTTFHLAGVSTSHVFFKSSPPSPPRHHQSCRLSGSRWPRSPPDVIATLFRQRPVSITDYSYLYLYLYLVSQICI